jgi:hypothetical protein
MKSFRLILTLLVLVSLIHCTKNESIQAPAPPDPSLKAPPTCTPNVIKYDDRDTLELLFPIYLPENCFQEPIMVTLYDVKSQGHTNVAASCRYNDHAKLYIHITGIGIVSGSLYDSYTSVNHHFNGSLTGQGAQVIRNILNSTLTNLTTGEIYSMSQTLHQTINANGDVTADTVIFHPCE